MKSTGLHYTLNEGFAWKPARQAALPPLEKDAGSFIAQDPARRNEYAIATFNRDVYLSPDSGKTWKQMAAHGQRQ